MAPIAWNPDLETGDELVDRQHRNIHRLLNELEGVKDCREEIARVLEQLLDHVLMHFDTEEALMRREAYPAQLLDEHVALHRDLTNAAREKVLEFRAGQLTHVAELVAFLRDWVANHVHGHDLAMIQHMKGRGAIAVLPEPWASQQSSMSA